MKALLSVYDKSGVVELARGLAAMGWDLVSSGNTAKVLREAGITVASVAEVTGAAEMLGGRVKTLHPTIHGGILANRADAGHMNELADRKIAPIDLVVSNLYPFVAEPSIEQIDIGGPTMVRAAAKNHESVGILVDPADYSAVLAELQTGELSLATRRRLARKAFAHTAAYDAAIVGWFDTDVAPTDTPLPDTLHLALEKADELRYGENPHQHGARYRVIHPSPTQPRGWWDAATQLHGKAMSYLNVYDTEAAWRLVHSIADDEPAAAVIKHANPAGAAIGADITDAYRLAHAGDPVSAFGGIVAVNQVVPLALANALSEIFTEVIVAPGFEADAMVVLAAKKNLRIIEAVAPQPAHLHLRSVDGGMLVQTADEVNVDRNSWTVATTREPTDAEWRDLLFAWRVAARVSSNCIVLAKDRQAIGIGAGQQNRRDAGRIATDKAAGRAKGGVCASDAFFPFRDGLDAAIEAGCRAVIQPGGSIRDDEVIAAANDADLAMVFTGERHFLH